MLEDVEFDEDDGVADLLSVVPVLDVLGLLGVESALGLVVLMLWLLSPWLGLAMLGLVLPGVLVSVLAVLWAIE